MTAVISTLHQAQVDRTRETKGKKEKSFTQKRKHVTRDLSRVKDDHSSHVLTLHTASEGRVHANVKHRNINNPVPPQRVHNPWLRGSVSSSRPGTLSGSAFRLGRWLSGNAMENSASGSHTNLYT
ncbi:hypothetical protein EYF80_047870 [Liparis tanakae]|uniref:Uncharacterized protein n=1 Tax=Liparis tanakae TaxID=230148 RepID=A0A4Z2FLB0_9TELE|nr:hypothetical protein EYF80_047870 [Liparis tanakae]